MIGIRVDSNEIIAIGHVMRCLSIAEQMKSKPIFICSEITTKNIITEAGYECICLNNKHNEKDKELTELEKLISYYNIKMLLIDSYFVTEYYLQELHKKTKLAYIDDLNSFKYDVDVLINYTYMTSESIYDKWKYSDVEFMLGSKFVPLSSQFRHKPIEIHKVENLLLTTGGTDNQNVIITMLRKLENTKYNVNVIVGKYYNNYQSLIQYVVGKDNIKLYYNINNVVEVMKKCDIAISAGGTTLVELATLGIPTICFSRSDNQLAGTQKYSEYGLMIYVGDVTYSKQKVVNNILDSLNDLDKNIEKRRVLSKKMCNEFDGNGAQRIAERLSEEYDYEQ